MTDELSRPNLQESDALLSELFEEVQKWEGTLAGGTKLGIGAEAVDSLRRSKVSFGNPRDRLIHLTEETFKNSGTELNDIYKQQMQRMQSQFDRFGIIYRSRHYPNLGSTAVVLKYNTHD